MPLLQTPSNVGLANADLRVHACAINARDLDSLAAHALRSAPCICDGEWMGEGPDAVRKALEKEFAVNDNLFAALGTVDGRPAVVEFDSGGTPRGSLHFVGDASGRIREFRIEHGLRNVVRDVSDVGR